MTQSLKTEPRIKRGIGDILCKVHVSEWLVVKYKHIKTKPRICILFILCLTWTVNASSLKQNIIVLKKYVLLSYHFGLMNRRRFCLQKGGSQEHISLITIMFIRHQETDFAACS